MSAGFSLEFLENERAALVAGAGPVERITFLVGRGDCGAYEEKQDGSAGERFAPSESHRAHCSQVTERLNKEREEEAGDRRSVVRVGPDDEVYRDEDEREREPQRLKLAIT